MADEQDKASKTEEPSSKRLKDAHDKGNFAKAQEIQVVFGLAVAFFVILFFARHVAISVAEAGAIVFGNLRPIEIDQRMVAHYGGESLVFVLSLVLPMLAGAVCAGLVAGGLQSGFRLTPKAVGWKFEKLNPVKGFKEKYSGQALVRFGVEFMKFLVIGMAVYIGVRRVTGDPIFFTRIEVAGIAQFIYDTVLLLLVILIVALGAIAAINFIYQKHKTYEDLRMTRQEVKDERKQQEGDPQIRAAQRQFARRLAQRQMFSAVPEADVIINNPTHYSVALRYDRSRDGAPLVLAKGKNLIALKIRSIAEEHGVPQVENRPLAQTLYKIGQPGRPIPVELYQMVAETLAYVYRTHRNFFHNRRLQERADKVS